MIHLSIDEARARMLGWLLLARPELAPGLGGAQALLRRLRCIQLDPLDRIGTNADLVALARVDGLRRGEVYEALLPGHAFEHFAKERCLVPADRLPAYRARALQAPWWRLGERLERLPEGLLHRVLAEVAERGPIGAGELSDHGRVEPLDWSGWKGTTKAVTMALEVLWTRCEVVVCGRSGRGKIYDLPTRALPAAAAAPLPDAPEAELLLDRVAACGLMALAIGPWWSGLRPARDAGLPAQLLEQGRLRQVQVGSARRPYLALPAFVEAPLQAPDERLRILGPLDPLLWDRKLVEQLFAFAYVWEVYKPAAQRRWGWYVVPLLHRGRLVGRLEAHMEGPELVVDRLWREVEDFPEAALEQALARHAAACAPPPASQALRGRGDR